MHDAFTYGHHNATRHQTNAIKALNARYPDRDRERIMPKSRTSSKNSDESIDSVVDNTAHLDTLSTGIWGATLAGIIGYQVAKHYDVLEPIYTFATNLLR